MGKEKKKNGGARKGAGRKSKHDEEKVNFLFINAMKQLYKQSTEDGAKIAFIKHLAESQRGQIFIAEHIFGKPKEKIEQTNINYNKDLTEEDVVLIDKAIEGKY